LWQLSYSEIYEALFLPKDALRAVTDEVGGIRQNKRFVSECALDRSEAYAGPPQSVGKRFIVLSLTAITDGVEVTGNYRDIPH
jgi:hypothetical protein